MPSITARARRKKKPDPKADVTDMASSGRYRRVDQDVPSGTFVRNVTTQRKSDQAKNTRSQSVPSLNSTDVVAKQPSPSRQPRSNSVRLSNSIKMFSIRRRIAKMFGSHSDLSGKGITTVTEHQSSGVYRPLGGYRPRSIGGSSDCSTSSLTSVPQQSEFSRHNSLRESSHSRVSQGSVFSSRQPSCDSADALNFSVHGSMVPSESTLRPRSIACMQRSGSSTSLKNNSLHLVDPRYYSLAALSPNRVDTHESFVHSMDERLLHSTRGGYQRGPPLLRSTIAPQEELETEEQLSGRVKPSDPEYRKVAENLMTCSPLPSEEIMSQQQMDISSRKTSTDMIDEGIPSAMSSPIVASFRSKLGSKFGNIRRPLTPDAGLASQSIPPEWEVALTANGLRYYINHQTQTTHWNIPSSSNDLSDDDSDLPSGWELVKSKRYGTYYVNHNNHTAQYQHPVHAGAPPPYHLAILQGEEEDRDRKMHNIPVRSHSHRSSQAHRILDPNSSLPRRSKSFRDALTENVQFESAEEVLHTRQLSTMTYVPPSPFQIAEIPFWLKEYVDAPFGSEMDTHIQWLRCSSEDLSGLDTMIKRLLKKSSEQLVKKFEYHKVALQKELDERQRQQARRVENRRKKEPQASSLTSSYTSYHHNGIYPSQQRGQVYYPSMGYQPPPTTAINNSNPMHSIRSSAHSPNTVLESHIPSLSPSFPSPPPPPPPSQVTTSTTTTVRSTDVYNGSEETFV